jgi:hypothetical protein
LKAGLETADGNEVETSGLPLLGLQFFERHCCAVFDILEKHFSCGVLDICGVGYFPRHGVWWCTLTYLEKFRGVFRDFARIMMMIIDIKRFKVRFLFRRSIIWSPLVCSQYVSFKLSLSLASAAASWQEL